MSAGYPKRPSHWAHRVVRSMLKSCAAQEIGAIAVNLVTFVAHTEDAKHYAGPVTFHNGQLLPILGVSKWDTLAAARSAAIEAGWLHYENPNPQGRSPGFYWSKIPPQYAELDDAPTDEGLTTEAIYKQGYRDGWQAAMAETLSPANGDSSSPRYPENGDSRGDSRGEPSTLSLSLSLEESPDSRPDDSQPQKPKRKRPEPNPEDRDTAEWMWQTILAFDPDHTPAPNLSAWANTIRLMRERDGRSDEQIRAVFTFASRDPFWQSNILSPLKLRKAFNTLRLQMQNNGRTRPQVNGRATLDRFAGAIFDPHAAERDPKHGSLD